MSRSDHRVRLSLGISGFGDLGQDYEDGFQRGGRSKKGNRSRETSRDREDDE